MSHESMQTGKEREKSENKKQQSKAVDLGVHNRFVCLIKKNCSSWFEHPKGGTQLSDLMISYLFVFFHTCKVENVIRYSLLFVR